MGFSLALFSVISLIILLIDSIKETDYEEKIVGFSILLFLLIIVNILNIKSEIYAIKSIETDEIGVSLKYYKKNKCYSVFIKWQHFIVKKGVSNERYPRVYFYVINKDKMIAKFYSNFDYNFSNQTTELLIQDLLNIKNNYA